MADPLIHRNIKLTVAYDGTNYHGFQRQANTAATIQQVLEERLAKIFGSGVTVTGAARTDAGVHAYGQVINFYTAGTIPTQKIPLAAKSVLPEEIVITAAEEVDHNFHARFSAKSKIYIYRIQNTLMPDPFARKYTWHIPLVLDVESMSRAIGSIKGTHDFSAFRASGGAPVNPVRTIIDAACRREGNIVEFCFWGNGFLYHMVRNLVGTLVDVGLGRKPVSALENILATRERKLAGVTAPPQGLFLKQVLY